MSGIDVTGLNTSGVTLTFTTNSDVALVPSASVTVDVTLMDDVPGMVAAVPWLGQPASGVPDIMPVAGFVVRPSAPWTEKLYGATPPVTNWLRSSLNGLR